VVALVIFGVGTDPAVRVVRAQPTASMEGRAATVAPPTLLVPQYGGQPGQPTAAQRAASEAHMEMSAQAWAARGASLPRSGRVSSVGPPPGSESSAPGPGPAADDTFQVFNLSTLNPAAGGLGSSSINEPSVAQAGKYVFYTWNWGAARSKNGAHGGLTWTYINPYADMPDFCCDQDVIYDKGRDIILWYRQAVVSVDGGSQNRFFLGVSGNGGASFCTYDFRPSGLGFTNRWFDYPRLALSNNYVYINTNLFVTGGGFDQHILMRWPLTALSNCAGFGFSWWGFAAGWSPAQVENAREIMYLGDQIATVPNVTTFRVYWQPEDTGTLSWVDRAITPFLFTDRFTAHCPVAGGADPCQRADMRITGGVLARNTPSPLSTGAAAAGQIDFYWNVKEGGSFPKPYTESAGFDEATLTYNARKLVWNSGTTWFYTAAAANDRGHVALSTMEFLPGANPRHEVSLDDDYNGSPPGWSLVVVKASTGVWTSSSSGDYLRARMHSPQGVQWIATGYTRDAATAQYRPHYVVFERARDNSGSTRFDKK
jgi:hypothetical protein